MRKEISKELWKGVITLYKGGELMQKITGHEYPNNSRVLLINNQGGILFFYDREFSVNTLNKLKK